MILAADYIARFLDHPTWPGAIVVVAVVAAIAWVVVTFIRRVMS